MVVHSPFHLDHLNHFFTLFTEKTAMTDIVTYAVQGHLGVITLSNPPVNALSQSKGVLQRILDAIKEGEHDSAVKAFLVIGSGRAFSGGADISEFGLPP